MPIRSYKPTTPSMRYIKRSTYEEITKTKPDKALVKIRKKTGGRNNRGRVTMRGIAVAQNKRLGTLISNAGSLVEFLAKMLR